MWEVIRKTILDWGWFVVVCKLSDKVWETLT